MAESIIRALLEITVYSGIIWAVVMLFKRVFRHRMSPGLHLAIWTLFILRLLIPVTFDSGFTLLPAPDVPAETEDASSPNSAPVRFFARPEISATSFVRNTSDSSEASPVRWEAENIVLHDGAKAAWDISIWETLTFVWISGAVIIIAFQAAGYRRLRTGVFQSETHCPERIEELFEDCRRDAGVTRRVNLIVQNRIAGPALMFPNIVVLPESALLLGRDRLRMAICHELEHFRRRDQVKALILTIMRAVYWFNPFVWLATREIREDIETACDAAVVSGWSKQNRAFYAQTVLFLSGRGEASVLGMASNGARKNAERRIRGIFLSRKSRVGTKLTAAFLAAVVGVVCFTTACQPTPQSEAVVQVSQPAPEESQERDDASHYQPVAYESESRWQVSESEDAGRFTVAADVDVLVPDVEKHPIQKLERRTFTVDDARTMTDYLTSLAGIEGDFYQLPLQMTKADYEAQIVALRETLAMDEQMGSDADAIRADQESIAALEEKWRDAPEEAPRTPAAMEFTYPTDYEGNPVTEDGERFMDLGTTTDDGTVATVHVRSGPLNEGDSNGASYGFSMVSWRDELMDEEALTQIAAERETVAEFKDQRDEEYARLDAMEAAIEKRMDAYESSPVSLETAQEQAQKIMEDLGITGVQITQARQALCVPADGSEESPTEESDAFTTPAAYIAFQRECGGIPCYTQQYVNTQMGNYEGMYSAPFFPEEGHLVLDQDGKVMELEWSNPAQVVETIAADTEILPFEEIQERAVQQLYYTVSASENPEQSEFHYDVTDVRLIATYANAKDDADASLATPAWCVTATGEGTLYADPGAPDTPMPVKYVDNQVIISAVDGAPVLMPNSIPLSEGGGD